MITPSAAETVVITSSWLALLQVHHQIHHSWSCRINLLLGIVNCSYKNVIVFCFDSSFLFIIEIPLADKVNNTSTPSKTKHVLTKQHSFHMGNVKSIATTMVLVAYSTLY